MSNQEILLKIMNDFIHPVDASPVTDSLSAEEWENLLKMASEHAVLPVVYEAVWKNESFQKVSPPLQMQIKSSVRRQVIVQMQTTDYFLGLYSEMEKRGITPLVMKGIICRQMYKLSDYRTSGDEDVFVKKEEFSELDCFLQEKGFQREEFENILEAHEITYVHPQNGMRLEVHLSLFPEESGSYGRLNREFPDVFERQSVQMIQGVEVHTLDETQHMLYLLCHSLKHFLHSGFGIRQLCDMVLFAETYGDKIDWEEVTKRTKRQHMYVFWVNLFDIGERYLGFSWEKASLKRPGKKLLDSQKILEDLLSSGVYGKSSDERIHSANITLQANSIPQKRNSRELWHRSFRPFLI